MRRFRVRAPRPAAPRARNAEQENAIPASNPENLNISVPLQIHSDAVSTLVKCKAVDARNLLILNVGYKLENSDHYDIGGVHGPSGKLFWFYFCTSKCIGNIHLLTLFVCHRTTGHFSIGVSNSDTFNTEGMPQDSTETSLPNTLVWRSFSSVQPERNYFLKTYSFNNDQKKSLDHLSLLIPIQIMLTDQVGVDETVVKDIKLLHDLRHLAGTTEGSDLALVSTSGTLRPVHRLVLAAHSSVLQQMMSTLSSQQLHLDCDEDTIDVLVEFLYTGTVTNILDKDCLALLQMADKFQLINLRDLSQFAAVKLINANNAVDTAVVAEKLELLDLLTIAHDFIKSHPEILDLKEYDLGPLKMTPKTFDVISEMAHAKLGALACAIPESTKIPDLWIRVNAVSAIVIGVAVLCALCLNFLLYILISRLFNIIMLNFTIERQR